MPVSAVLRHTILPIAVAALATAAIGQVPAAAQREPTTTPAATPSAKLPSANLTVPEIVSGLRAKDAEFRTLFPDLAALADPAKRKEHSAKGAALLNGILSDIDALAAAQPQAAKSRPEARGPYESLLVAIGDAATVADLDRRSAGGDPEDSVRAKRISLLGRWYGAGADATKQKAIVDDFEPLAKAHPTDMALTALAVQLRQSNATPDAGKRLDVIASTVMKNTLADRYKSELEATAKLAALEGKPMVLAGKLPDGRDFSTADWRGKVILVDFWAVWCVPCRAELPRVKKAYAAYHDKGLEVLGVSNDYSAEKLNGYAQQEAMPWPNLFDAEAAADQTWHPLAKDFGVRSIPTMFLIDKAGICRTVNARTDFETLIPKLLAE